MTYASGHQMPTLSSTMRLKSHVCLYVLSARRRLTRMTRAVKIQVPAAKMEQGKQSAAMEWSHRSRRAQKDMRPSVRAPATRTELEDVRRRAVVGRVHGAEDAEDEEDH